MKIISDFGAKVFDYLKNKYEQHEKNRLLGSMGYLGQNVEIQYPADIYPPENVYVQDDVTILKDARINVYNNLTGLEASIKIGRHCFIGYKFTALVGANIDIEDNVLIASNVTITSENHGINPQSDTPYMDQPLECKAVTIGEGSWIGQNVTILSGVAIGKKCVVGAGSVVTKSVEDYCLIAGIPAKTIKKYNFDKGIWEKV